VTPQRRIALVSIVAALVLIAVKLVTGLATGSLGLLSEAAHSGTDLVAAVLTFFAVGVAVRPADPGHPYGHAKAEHLAALAEAAILIVLALFVANEAVDRLRGADPDLDVTWWALAVIAFVIVLDASRALVSFRAARQWQSPAFASSALHFASDLAGSSAVFVGLVAARGGYEDGDAIAALFVAVLVVLAASRLIRQNVDILMDRVPARAHDAAREAIETQVPDVQLRRLRMRRAAREYFADVVIGVPPAAGVEQAHAAASAVEEAVERAVPGADVVVHVEPGEAAALRERAEAAAMRDPRVREIHNITVLEVGNRIELSLHLKLPASLTLAEAHEVATSVEMEILNSNPQIDDVHTHLEPLAEPSSGRALSRRATPAAMDAVRRVVLEVTRNEPRSVRFIHTDVGLVAFLTLGMDANRPLSDAHALASEIEERIRRAHPEISEVVVHTEP
jgi:cation diffusion facilitator family transporter